jgi:hypothetical protein
MRMRMRMIRPFGHLGLCAAGDRFHPAAQRGDYVGIVTVEPKRRTLYVVRYSRILG